MRFVLKFLSVIFFLIVFSLVYLSIFGIETNKFNNQILNKVERINKDIKFELKKNSFNDLIRIFFIAKK